MIIHRSYHSFRPTSTSATTHYTVPFWNHYEPIILLHRLHSRPPPPSSSTVQFLLLPARSNSNHQDVTKSTTINKVLFSHPPKSINKFICFFHETKAPHSKIIVLLYINKLQDYSFFFIIIKEKPTKERPHSTLTDVSMRTGAHYPWANQPATVTFFFVFFPLKFKPQIEIEILLLGFKLFLLRGPIFRVLNQTTDQSNFKSSLFHFPCLLLPGSGSSSSSSSWCCLILKLPNYEYSLISLIFALFLRRSEVRG